MRGGGESRRVEALPDRLRGESSGRAAACLRLSVRRCGQIGSDAAALAGASVPAMTLLLRPAMGGTAG